MFFSSTTTRSARIRALADGRERKRAERADVERAHRASVGAHRVDDLLDRPVDRAERDDDRVGALACGRGERGRPTARPKRAGTRWPDAG